MLNKKGITQRTAANVPLVVSEVIEIIHLERAVMVKFFEANLNHMLLKDRLKPLTMTMLAILMTNYV